MSDSIENDPDVLDLQAMIAIHQAVAKAMLRLTCLSSLGMLFLFVSAMYLQGRILWASRIALLLTFGALLLLASSVQRLWLELQMGRKGRTDLIALLEDRYEVNASTAKSYVRS
jgi:hypothetical protein